MATQEQPKRCPLCGLREHAAVSDESRRRDVSADRWMLTPKGAAVLAELRQRERERQYWDRYHRECA